MSLGVVTGKAPTTFCSLQLFLGLLVVASSQVQIIWCCWFWSGSGVWLLLLLLGWPGLPDPVESHLELCCLSFLTQSSQPHGSSVSILWQEPHFSVSSLICPTQLAPFSGTFDSLLHPQAVYPVSSSFASPRKSSGRDSAHQCVHVMEFTLYEIPHVRSMLRTCLQGRRSWLIVIRMI